MSDDVVKLRVALDDGRRLEVTGRMAWALHALMAAGDKGLTSIERPAPRWSHYVWQLRRERIVIETRREAHGGAFSGKHGRYVLRSALAVERIDRAGGAGRAA